MLTGLTPFWSEDHATMYRRVLHDELTFNEDSNRVMDHDTKTLLRGVRVLFSAELLISSPA